MKPPRFAYAKPATIEETLALLDQGDEVKILSGGQSLVPVMNLRLARPDVLVDINGLPGLDKITVADGMVRIGALVRQAEVERSPEVRQNLPLVIEALRYVGHPATRNRGTFCGSIAHADPAAELPAVLAALGGEVVARGPDGERVINVDDFFKSYMTTALSEREVLTEVRVRVPSPGARSAFEELARRHGDFALAGIAATAEPDAAGTWQRVRIAALGVASVPFRVTRAEEVLVGAPMDDSSVVAEAARLVEEEVPSTSDVHASAEYRKELAGVLTRRALERMAAGGAQ